MSDPTKTVLLRRREVELRTSLARSTLYERIAAGTFPKPINLGGRAVAWIEAEVDGWVAQRITQSRQGSHTA